jgi:hypothetical protein
MASGIEALAKTNSLPNLEDCLDIKRFSISSEDLAALLQQNGYQRLE